MPKTNRKTDLSYDPVVEGIRDLRKKWWKQAGGTAAGYLALMREMAAKREQKAKPAGKSVRRSGATKRRAATPRPRKA